MKTRILLLSVIIITSYQGFAQLGKIDDTKYFMSFEPVIGSLSGKSNISEGINPNLTLESKGLVYGVDWVSARWAEVDDGFLVPKLQIPMRFRYMRSGSDGLSTSDGTYFPEEARSDPKDKPWVPFNYFDFSIDLYISPYYYQTGSVIITPKFGVGIDLGHHDYNIDLSKFLGKEGTVSNLGDDINASYSPFYTYTFWEDLYGINVGSYFNISQRVLIDAGWEYYPGRFMTKLMKSTIHSIWNAVPGTGESKHSKLSRFSVKGQVRIISWVSAFVKYENSNYKFEGPIIGGNQKFYQKYSNLLLGITLGGPSLN
ncbi:MAG: hypothetical protein HGB12_12200 [Bacteroidetes bacterium]|nr:hypothetical protein [Bacteroidota bacterium]